MKSLEAVIAILVIMGVYAVIYNGSQAVPDFETANWKMKGIETLTGLDRSGQLRPYVLNNDNTTIDTKISSFIPGHVEHQVQICSSTDCYLITKDVRKIVSVDYIIAGDAANSTNKRIILYMWTAD